MKSRVIVVALSVLVAGCVKVHMQSETPERRTEVSTNQGKDFKVNFADRLRLASPAQKFDMTRTLIDSVSASYLRYGFHIADQWRQGNAGRGQVISADEMRTVVTNSNQSQQPLTQAYEESIDYGLEQIKLSQGVDQSLVTQLEQYREHYYDLYNGVFFPKGTVAEYENRLNALKLRGEQLSQQLEQSTRSMR